VAHRNQVSAGLLSLIFFAGLAGAQGPGGAKATVLKDPADWRFERLPIPPQFAPDIRITGFEEVRFAPGMFDTSSPNYFTYALVICAEGGPELDRAGVEDFLRKYFTGLSVGVGRGKGLKPDAAQMSAEVAGADAKNRYTAKVVFFDTFNDGRKVILNMEAHVVPRPEAKKTYLTLLVSPKGPESSVWPTLREIEKKLQFSEP
jgi:hypothetical protein